MKNLLKSCAGMILVVVGCYYFQSSPLHFVLLFIGGGILGNVAAIADRGIN